MRVLQQFAVHNDPLVRLQVYLAKGGSWLSLSG